MKKYRIELSKKQMRLIANCLEDVSRFASGQCEMKYTIQEIVKDLPLDSQIRIRNGAEERLKQAKRILLPNMADNASIGKNGSDFISNSHHIYKTIQQQLEIENDTSPTFKMMEDGLSDFP
tara:strand:- start:1446 stop:1808 length:363 start_codon:yes stop_codon:yes gene_type:complete